MAKSKVITLKDGDFEKKFKLTTFKATTYMHFVDKVLSMLATTDEINPDIIKQFIYNRVSNGMNIIDPKKVDQAVEKEMQRDPLDLIFNVVKSLLINIDKHENAILEYILSCVSYANGTSLVSLQLYPGDGDVNMIIEDGANLYLLCWEVIQLNFGGLFSPSPKP